MTQSDNDAARSKDATFPVQSMTQRLRTLLLQFKYLSLALRYRRYAPKLKSLGYPDLLEDPAYRTSPLLAAVHFHTYGIKEIIDGFRPLYFNVDGTTYRYCEDLYLFLTPSAKKAIASGQYPNGLTYFVMEGYEELKSGKECGYLNPVARQLAELDPAAVINGTRRLIFYAGGLEYDYVESLYRQDHPEAQEAVSEGKYHSLPHHFLSVTLPQIEAGTAQPYRRDLIPRLERVYEGGSKTGSTLCLFAHYDADGQVDPYVIRYLEGLKTMDCEIVFISGSATEAEWSKVAHLCSQFILRNEHGRDFGSWYVGLKQWRARLNLYRHVVLANDSVYFPLFPVENLIDEMDRRGLDLWGVHESLQILPFHPKDLPQYHVQSFFFGISKEAIRAGLVDQFLERFESHPVLSKTGQIHVFEFWFAAAAKALGLRVGALVSIDEVYKEYSGANPGGFHVSNINPTIHLWKSSVRDHHSPILKAELLRDDHQHVFDYDELAAIVDQEFYDTGLILRHGERLKSKL